MLKTTSPAKSVPVQNPYFFNAKIVVGKIQSEFSTFSQALRRESKNVSSLGGEPHGMLNIISSTKSVPVQSTYLFNIMVEKSNLNFQHLARQSCNMGPLLIAAMLQCLAEGFFRTTENLFLQPGSFSSLRTCWYL